MPCTVLRCPQCDAELSRDGSSLRCVGCRQSWPVDRDGVYRLCDPGTTGIGDEMLADRLVQIRSGAPDERDCEPGLPRVAAPSDVRELDPACADWLVLGDFARRTVLVLGGPSSVALRIAERARRTVFLDPSLQRTKLVATRCARRGEDVVAVHAGFGTTPVRADAVDSVVGLGVLDRLSLVDERSQSAAQSRVLAWIRRALRSSGDLYLGVRNRYDPTRVLGDEPAGQSLTVQALRAAFRRAVRGLTDHPDAGLRSLRRYQQLLDAAGFERVDTYYASPGYVAPECVSRDPHDLYRFMIERVNLNPRGWYPDVPNRLARAVATGLLRTGGLRYLSPAYIFHARGATS